jgi:hypothetical protein
MCIHTLRMHIARPIPPPTAYPQFSSAQFVADKKSFLDSLGVNIFSAVEIHQFLHLVKEVSGAYNRPTLFLLGLCGALATAPQSFNTLLPALERSPQKDIHGSCIISPVLDPTAPLMEGTSPKTELDFPNVNSMQTFRFGGS